MTAAHEDWSQQGPRLTAAAIKDVISALPARQYLIRLVHPETSDFPTMTREYDQHKLLKSVKFLRLKNREGCVTALLPFGLQRTGVSSLFSGCLMPFATSIVASTANTQNWIPHLKRHTSAYAIRIF